MMDPTHALSSHANISTGNAFVDEFLKQAGASVRLDSGEEEWQEIEKKFEKWWNTYQAWNYEE